MENCHDSLTNLHKRIVVLSWTLCMAEKQWVTGFFWHRNTMVPKYQPSAGTASIHIVSYPNWPESTDGLD